jgi:hypothetical protein
MAPEAVLSATETRSAGLVAVRAGVDGERRAQAVLQLLSDEPLSDGQRAMLAALLIVVGELDHASLNPAVATVYQTTICALGQNPSSCSPFYGDHREERGPHRCY